jgi:adenylate kinase
MKQLVLIIGAPGSGKTTDAERIAQQNSAQITHFSTGDLLRAEVASASARGKLIDQYISKGLIVPIEIAVETIVGAIKNANTPMIVIDGYPRSIEQMEALDHFLAQESDIVLESVIEVMVSEPVARERVLGRARGSDDNEKVFNHRMEVYTQPLEAIRAFYAQKQQLHVINGERDIDAIVDEMEAYIKAMI